MNPHRMIMSKLRCDGGLLKMRTPIQAILSIQQIITIHIVLHHFHSFLPQFTNILHSTPIPSLQPSFSPNQPAALTQIGNIIIKYRIRVLKQQIMEKRQGNIKVFSRFRPFNSKENAANPCKLHRIANNKQLIIKEQKQEKQEEMSFLYDYVFDVDSTQQQVFEQVGYPVLNNIIEGYNGTIMAYGQTSSGKTHTMQGYDLNDKENKGIMPRIIDQLFNAIHKSTDSIQFKLKISVFEIYMEKIRDLLDVTKNDLKIRQNKQGVYIENLTELYVSSQHEIFKIISIGQKNRITCSTNMNEHSSRSHMIFVLTVNQFNNLESSSKTSKLYLIDLAGSEKISKTGAEGKVLEEAKKINLSLTNLGKVIKSLSERGGHVPYRDSKLTRILKDSLGGNSKTTLIVTCSPHQMHLPETISTLRFAENAQKIKNKPKINRELTVQELQKLIQQIQAEAEQKSLKIQVLEDYITTTLKAELPKEIVLKKSQEIQLLETNLNETLTINGVVNAQAEQRIIRLEEEIQSNQNKMKNEMEKYYNLKKQYNSLHQNLTEILKENIAMHDKINEKKHKNAFSDKTITNNVHLIRLIVGEIMTFLGRETETEIMKHLQNSFWFQKVMIQQTPCSDYWHNEKEEMNRQLQELMSQSQKIEQLKSIAGNQYIERNNQDNLKVVELEGKLDAILHQYQQMVNTQTTWKAECQLYERKLRKKEEKILELERELQEVSEQIESLNENDYDERLSVCSNKIVKPLKGGSQFF